MKNIAMVDINFVSGGACKTKVIAVSVEGNQFLDNVRPLPNCIIKGEYSALGFKNTGTIGGKEGKFDFTSSYAKIICRCSDEYTEDTVEIYPYNPSDEM